MAPVNSSSLIGRDQQMDDSFSYVMTQRWIRSDDSDEIMFYFENDQIITPNHLRIHQWVIHKWLNIRKWVIHLLISTNQRRVFDWGHLRKKNTILFESSLRIHQWVIHKWLNIWKWVIHLLISTNQRRAFNWGHLRKKY